MLVDNLLNYVHFLHQDKRSKKYHSINQMNFLIRIEVGLFLIMYLKIMTCMINIKRKNRVLFNELIFGTDFILIITFNV